MTTRHKLYLVGALLFSLVCAPAVGILAASLAQVGAIGGWFALCGMFYFGRYVGQRTEQERQKEEQG